MAQAQYTEIVCVKVTPEMKKAIEKKLPNPSQFIRNAIKRALK
jgi:hypothetical protein